MVLGQFGLSENAPFFDRLEKGKWSEKKKTLQEVGVSFVAFLVDYQLISVKYLI